MSGSAFNVAKIPALIQGAGALSALPSWVSKQGYSRAAIITGGRSLDRSGVWGRVAEEFRSSSIEFQRFHSHEEPSPGSIDAIAAEIHRTTDPAQEVVLIGIGGGSVIDSAKAVAALLGEWRDDPSIGGGASITYPSVRSFLEGVGDRVPKGVRNPLVAVPTTSGTGSEATKNAVISEIGPNGFKKSLRHDAYVPDLAILDPLLMVSCPPEVTAASGLDAVTQLLESFVSTAASPFTDLLALEGLRIASQALAKAYKDGKDLQARADMAYAAYLSGITLANADLGVIHGAAGVLGSLVPIPHGVACGTLLAAATATIIDRIAQTVGPDSIPYQKYISAGRAILFDNTTKNVKEIVTSFLDRLFDWQEEMRVPRLGEYGLSTADLHQAASMTGLKKTPVKLDVPTIEKILTARL